MPATITKPVFESRFSKTPNIRVCVFGKPDNFRVGDWTALGRYVPHAKRATELGVKTLMVPRPSEFNGQVVPSTSYNNFGRLDGVIVKYGVDADGSPVRPGQAICIGSGDCPTIVASVVTDSGNICVAAHGGCACHFPPPIGKAEQPVVRSMMRWIPEAYWPKVEVLVTCGIGPANFCYPLDDKTYGELNRQRRSHVVLHYPAWCSQILPDGPLGSQIDLFKLIQAQFAELGVPPEQVVHDGLDTYTDERLWSNRRNESGRNAIFVIHEE